MLIANKTALGLKCCTIKKEAGRGMVLDEMGGNRIGAVFQIAGLSLK